MDSIVSTESALQIGGGVVKRDVGYFFNYKEKIKEVKHYLEKLNDARKRVQNDVEVAKKNAEEIEDDVNHWLQQVDDKIRECESFLSDGGHEKTRCSTGFFPNNLQLRYQLGRRAMKMIEEIKADELWNKKFDKVSYQVGPSMDVGLSNTNYESFVSRQETMEMIMQALENSTISMIGVYGAGGVGKTTLVKEVAKKALEKKLFNMVVIANITRNPDIKKVQGQIAQMLGMRLEEESEIVRANCIRRRLKKEKEHTLVILDDLWDGLDLNRLGIPRSEDDDDSQRDVNDIADFGYNELEKGKLSTDYSKMRKGKLYFDYNKAEKKKLSGDRIGCKIFLTSRSKEVLCNQMDVPKRSTFEVRVLDEKEAETLLKKLAEEHDENSDGKATEIAKMCGRLPIALVHVGRMLKNKRSSVWEDVCKQMKSHNFTGEQESIEFSVKLSYNHLKNEQLKHIFLHCARMGNDPLIMDLVKFCAGLGLLQGVYTIKEARCRVNMLIEELKESSLLMESYSTNRFNMHDIVRDVALSISSKEKHVFFMKNGILDEWPRKDELERCMAIFLHYCDINDELPESIYCPRLEVFHFDSKDDSLKIPDNFFKDIVELRVLILTGVNLSSLPSSIKCLTKLRMLCLERCTIGENLSIIGELKKLRILTLSGSTVESLPIELGQLDKLQLFDLSNCSELRVIPCNIISRMNSLEEFYMRDNLILWETEQRKQSENAILSELRHLNQLRNLEIHIPSVVHFPQNLFFDKLDSYKIVIGEFNMLTMDEFKMPDKYDAVKFLALHLKEGINIHSEEWIKMLFKRVENLMLGELNDVHNVFYELNVEGFPNLKHLYIANNFGIKYIIKSEEQLHPWQAFQKLESMCLYKLENLEKICDNQLAEPSFCSLKVIKIKTCGQLKKLFPFSLFRLLTMLETIEVCDCAYLKEIVSVERQTYTSRDVKDVTVEFPQLRLLTLQSLPAFTCLYTSHGMPSIVQTLEAQVPNKATEVGQGDTLAHLPLFNEKVSIPKLEWLELSSINIQKIWSDKSLHYFQNLLTLKVTDCGNLKYLLSLSMARSLLNLQTLFVSVCGMMEDIFRIEDARQNIDIFPNLKKMEINHMEELNTIWKPNIGLYSFLSLDSLIIRKCHKLVTIFPSYMGQSFQSLQSLEIIDCMLVETIFDFTNIPQTNDRNETNLHNVFLEALPNLVHVWKEDTSEVLKYNNLQSVSIDGCPNLKYLFPFSVANDLKKLEVLQVSGCWEMKEIVAWDKGSNEKDIIFKFPHLNTVRLQQLFEFETFYRGSHTLEWPSLVKLSILYCYKLETPTTETTNSQVNTIVSATEKVIYNLKYIAMSLKEAEWLQKYIVSVHRMDKLQSLVLYGLKNAEILFWLLRRLHNLESLTLESCLFKKIWARASPVSHKKIGVVIQLKELILNNLLYLEEIGFEHNPLLQRLERLVVLRCLKLTNLAPSSVSYSHLTHLEVTGCIRLMNLMTFSTAKSLVQLVTMKVTYCEMIEEIIAENEKENVQEIEFRQLKALELVALPRITSFCSSEKCDLKFPLLEILVVCECPQMTKFGNVQSAPNLQKAHFVAGEKDGWYWEGDLNNTLQKRFTDEGLLLDEKNIILLRDGHLPQDILCKLNILNLCFDDNDNKKDALPFDFLHKVPNLEQLLVERCFGLKEIFPSQKLPIHDGILLRLKELRLVRLKELESIGLEHPWVKPFSEKLETLDVKQCSRLEKLVCCAVSFINLRQLDIGLCERMTYLFTFSTAKSLVHLESLLIKNCKSLEEIVKKEDEDASNEIIFKRLNLLELLYLPRLASFYSGNATLQFSSLQSTRITECPNLRTFSWGVINAPMLFGIYTSSSDFDLYFHDDLNTTMERLDQLKLAKDAYDIKVLEFGNHPQLEEIWLGVVPIPSDNSFSNLKSLVVENCESLSNVIPFHLLPFLCNLQEIEVRNCQSVKAIFEVKDLKPTSLLSLPLKKLTLNELPNLKHIWNMNPDEILSLQNLQEVYIDSCQSLKSLFPTSVSNHLVLLDVKFCTSLVEIFSEDEAGLKGETKQFIFHCLTSLTLWVLPKLKHFYNGKHSLEWPMLKRLDVYHCYKLKLFKSKQTSGEDAHIQDQRGVPIDQQAIFSVEKVFPNLEKLSLRKEDAMSILQGQFQAKTNSQIVMPSMEHPAITMKDTMTRQGQFDANVSRLLQNLKHLILQCYHKDGECSIFSSGLLEQIPHIENLEVRCSSFNEIFSSQRPSPDCTKILSKLKGLHLNFLYNLNSIGLEHSWVEPLLKTLEILEVLSCRCMKILVPSTVSFSNLTFLKVNACHGLVHLLTSSTAKSLGQLKRLSVWNCQAIMEIVSKEVDDHEEITFSQLNTLSLVSLPSILGFYLGTSKLKFPSLDQVTLAGCPQMKYSFVPDLHQFIPKEKI